MSISTTRKVGSFTHGAQKSTLTESGQDSFVDKVDAANNVLVGDYQEGHSQNQNNKEKEEETEEEVFNNSTPYISNAINIQEEYEAPKTKNRLNSVNTYKKNLIPQQEEYTEDRLI